MHLRVKPLFSFSSGVEYRFDCYIISLQVLSLEFEDDDDFLYLDETVSQLYLELILKVICNQSAFSRYCLSDW